MHRSFASGTPQRIDAVRTIADSLGAPFSLPYSFSLCRKYVDQLVLVSDEQLKSAMRFMFHEMKIAVEAACAATTAALLGPLASSLSGRKVVIVLCGSNIDWHSFAVQAELGTRHAA
jgi:threonine dehydratase